MHKRQQLRKLGTIVAKVNSGVLLPLQPNNQRPTSMSSRMIKIFLALALMAGSGTASAATFVTWTSPTSGSVNSVTVTATYSQGSPSLANFDLSGANFNPAGGASQQMVDYSVNSAITWTFSSAVTNLDLYALYWRGTASGIGGPSNGRYVFSATPTIQSGLSGASIVTPGSGNPYLQVGSSGFYSGILRFSGPITSLTMYAPTGASPSGQLYTLAFDAASSAVPDGASTFGLLGAAVGALGLATRRRRRS